MLKIFDGGPAFPMPAFDSDAGNGEPTHTFSHDCEPGMSLRDYLAAHAPEPPDWFMMGRPELPPVAHMPASWSTTKWDRYHGWGDWLNEEDIEATELEEFKRFRQEQADRATAYKAAVEQFQLNREAEWAYRRADAMLARRQQQ